jgi:hypothetical protein
MPNKLSFKDRIDLGVVCDGQTEQQAISEIIIADCGLRSTPLPERFIDTMFELSEGVVLSLNGEENAEQA